MFELLAILWHNALAFIVILSVIVFVHEAGHFLVARYYGVRVKVFSVGFGKELYGFTGKQSGTRYKLGMLPLGGYVALYGEQGNELGEDDPEISFSTRTPYARAWVIAAGPLANFILGFVLLFIFLMFQGIHSHQLNGVKIAEIFPASSAADAGLKNHDRIIAIDDDKIKNFALIIDKIKKSEGSALNFRVARQNLVGHEQILNFLLTPKLTEENGKSRYQIGIRIDEGEFVPVGMGQAVILSGNLIGRFSWETLKALKEIVTGARSTEDLGGPVRIATTTKAFAQSGFLSLIFFTAILSVNLGLVNLFPIPILDGGHLVFIFVEMIRGKPISAELKEKIMRFGFAFLLALMLFVTINDIMYLQ